jgi:hypothetical protein
MAIRDFGTMSRLAAAAKIALAKPVAPRVNGLVPSACNVV